MAKLTGLVVALRTERDRAQKELEQLNTALAALGGLGRASGGAPRGRPVKKRRPMSADARKRIAAAQRLRWAKWKRARRNK